MTEVKLTHSFTVPPEKIFPYLTNFDKFVSVHPIIYKHDKISEHESLLYEAVNFILFKYKFSYKGKISDIELNRKVMMSANPQPDMFISFVFLFEEKNGGTEINETICIEGPALKRISAKPVIVKSHYKVMENIRKEFIGKNL